MLMRGLDDISPYIPKGNMNPNYHSPVSSAMREAQETKYIIPSQRVPKLRPSSFPKCSILDYLKMYRHKKLGYIEETKDFGSSYFTGVGTVVHEIIQHYIGQTKQVYGDWKCINLECEHGQAACTIRDATGKVVQEGKLTSTGTTDNLCPGCKRPMFYEELEISALGSVGHVDCVFVIRDGRWWVVDYKTTLKRKIDEHKLPEANHLYQLRAYAYILKFYYDLPIQGFSLVYMPRDNPFKFYEYSHDFDTPEEHKIAEEVLKGERKKYKASERSCKTGNPKYAIEAKPCSCEEDYHEKINFYNECPLLGICFKPDKLEAFLDKYTRLHKEKAVPEMITFTDLLQVISQNEYRDLKEKYGKPVSTKKRTRRKRKASLVQKKL